MIEIQRVRALAHLLLCHPNWSDRVLARQLGISKNTVARYRARLRRSGLTSAQVLACSDTQLVAALGLFKRHRSRRTTANTNAAVPLRVSTVLHGCLVRVSVGGQGATQVRVSVTGQPSVQPTSRRRWASGRCNCKRGGRP